jgi:hypothetical protein
MRTLLAGFLSLALGLVAAFCGALHRSPTPFYPRPEPGPVELWVADRAGGAIHGLDRDLMPVRAFEVPCPVALANGGAGRLWVASAIQGRRWARHVLALLEPTGRPVVTCPIGTVECIHASGSGGVFVHRLDHEHCRAVLEHITSTGIRSHVAVADWFDATASRGDEVLVATQDGWLTLHDLESGPGCVRVGAVPGLVSAIAADPSACGWWVAWRAAPRVGERKMRGRLSRVVNTDAGLEVESTMRMPFLVRTLVMGGPYLWALEEDGARVQRIQIGGAKGPHPVVRLLDSPPLGAVLSMEPEFGCIVFTAESLLALDADVGCHMTQGTFRSISSVTTCGVSTDGSP